MFLDRNRRTHRLVRRLRHERPPAPFAPQAVNGFTPQILLFGNNPISQMVDPDSMTIINTTLPGHAFYRGTVTIHVSPAVNNTSDITITGVGTGQEPLVNDIVGLAFFGSVADLIMQGCNSEYGVPFAPGP
jgi:hypothetical protein